MLAGKGSLMIPAVEEWYALFPNGGRRRVQAWGDKGGPMVVDTNDEEIGQRLVPASQLPGFMGIRQRAVDAAMIASGLGRIT